MSTIMFVLVGVFMLTALLFGGGSIYGKHFDGSVMSINGRRLLACAAGSSLLLLCGVWISSSLDVFDFINSWISSWSSVTI